MLGGASLFLHAATNAAEATSTDTATKRKLGVMRSPGSTLQVSAGDGNVNVPKQPKTGPRTRP